MKSNVLDLSEVAKTEGDKVLVPGVGKLSFDRRRWGVIAKLNLDRNPDRFLTVGISQGEKSEQVLVSLTAIKFCPKDDGAKIHGRYRFEGDSPKKMRRISLSANVFRPGDLPKFVEEGVRIVSPQAFAATQ